MSQRLGLLSREDETARFRLGQCGLALPVPDVMAFPLGHEVGGAVQALFGLDHVPCGEAILAAAVRTRIDDRARRASLPSRR